MLLDSDLLCSKKTADNKEEAERSTSNTLFEVGKVGFERENDV